MPPRSWPSTCTSTRTTWTSARTPPPTSTPSCETSTGGLSPRGSPRSPPIAPCRERTPPTRACRRSPSRSSPPALARGDHLQVLDARPRHHISRTVDLMEGAIWRDPDRVEEWIGELSTGPAGRGLLRLRLSRRLQRDAGAARARPRCAVRPGRSVGLVRGRWRAGHAAGRGRVGNGCREPPDGRHADPLPLRHQRARVPRRLHRRDGGRVARPEGRDDGALGRAGRPRAVGRIPRQDRVPRPRPPPTSPPS